MINSVIIGFGHRARSGKDSAASEIVKQRGSETSIEVIHFAKALKQEVNNMAFAAGGMRELFGRLPYVVPDWVKYDPDNPMDDPLCPFGKQRALLQFHGTEFRRAQDDAYWLKKHAQAVEESKATYILVPDLRFENEFEYIKNRGGLIARVDRKDLPAITTSSHASETSLAGDFPWDYILTNDGSLEEFKEGALALFDDIATSFAYGHGV